jgi:hypothetical protein
LSFEDDRTRQVRTGQAVNLAIQMAVNEHIGEPATAVLATAAHLIGPALSFIDQAQEAALADAQKAAVVQAFPGAQIEPQAQAQIPQAEAWHSGAQLHHVPNQNPVFVRREPGGDVGPAFDSGHLNVQPTPVPGVQDGDPAVAALWQQYFQDPSAFWDNRQGKRNPKAPDFKHRTSGEGLWIQSKKNPSWVPAQLAQRGLA